MSTVLPHFALQLALSGGGVSVPVDASLVASAAVTVTYSDYHPTSSNSAASAGRNVIGIAAIQPPPEPEWVIDWLIRTADEAPEEEVAKLRSDLSATVDRDLYGT